MNFKSILNEYLQIVNTAFGAYSDSISGLRKVRNDAINLKSKTIEGATAYVSYVPENYNHLNPPSQPDFSKAIHTTTADEIISRNNEGGVNFNIIGRMTILLIYQSWEDNYRDKFSKVLNIKSKNDLKLNAFGDLRNFRTSIIHNNSIAIDEVDSNNLFKFFSKGEEINFKGIQLREIQRYFQFNFVEELSNFNSN